MSDGSLSQEEIDALLPGGGMDFGMEAASQESGLSEQERQEFTRLLNTIKVSQAANLTGMAGKTVDIGQLTVEILSRDDFLAAVPDQLVEVKIDFTQGLAGDHSYLMDQDFGTKLAGLLMGQEAVELDDAALSALGEAANTIAGPAVKAFEEKTGKSLMNAPAQTQFVLKANVRLPQGSFVRVIYPVSLEGTPHGQFMEIFELSHVKEIAALPQSTAGVATGMQSGLGAAAQSADQSQIYGPQPGMGQPFMGPSQAPPNVQSVQYPSLQSHAVGSEQGNIGLLMDVFMEMTVELGRTKKPIREILGMGEGTIIELDKLAGEPVDILVNHKLIAMGEVVVIDENFGVRVTKIVSPIDSMSDLS